MDTLTTTVIAASQTAAYTPNLMESLAAFVVSAIALGGVIVLTVWVVRKI